MVRTGAKDSLHRVACAALLAALPLACQDKLTPRPRQPQSSVKDQQSGDSVTHPGVIDKLPDGSGDAVDSLLPQASKPTPSPSPEPPQSKLGWDGTSFRGTATLGVKPIE